MARALALAPTLVPPLQPVGARAPRPLRDELNHTDHIDGTERRVISPTRPLKATLAAMSWEAPRHIARASRGSATTS